MGKIDQDGKEGKKKGKGGGRTPGTSLSQWGQGQSGDMECHLRTTQGVEEPPPLSRRTSSCRGSCSDHPVSRLHTQGMGWQVAGGGVPGSLLPSPPPCTPVCPSPGPGQSTAPVVVLSATAVRRLLLVPLLVPSPAS